MALLNARASLSFRCANMLLLDAAENPANHADIIDPEAITGPGTVRKNYSIDWESFIGLSRQACACIVINCAAELWSVMAHGLLILEPSDPLLEDMRSFIKEDRRANLRFFEGFYKLCGKPFKGTVSYDDLKVIYELRDAIVHDHPDKANPDIDEEMNSWLKKLKPRLSEAELGWLPIIPTIFPSDRLVPTADACIAIMNFMRFPLAKWVVKRTTELTNEFRTMYFRHPGPKRTGMNPLICNPDMDATTEVSRAKIEDGGYQHAVEK